MTATIFTCHFFYCITNVIDFSDAFSDIFPDLICYSSTLIQISCNLIQVRSIVSEIAENPQNFRVIEYDFLFDYRFTIRNQLPDIFGSGKTCSCSICCQYIIEIFCESNCQLMVLRRW